MYWSAGDRPEVPAEFVTVTSTTPALTAAGMTRVNELVEFTAYVLTGMLPTWTDETLAKLVPINVTLLPPAVEPLEADKPVTAGGRTEMVRSAYLRRSCSRFR